jgi:hypothetical protein
VSGGAAADSRGPDGSVPGQDGLARWLTEAEDLKRKENDPDTREQHDDSLRAAGAVLPVEHEVCHPLVVTDWPVIVVIVSLTWRESFTAHDALARHRLLTDLPRLKPVGSSSVL